MVKDTQLFYRSWGRNADARSFSWALNDIKKDKSSKQLLYIMLIFLIKKKKCISLFRFCEQNFQIKEMQKYTKVRTSRRNKLNAWKTWSAKQETYNLESLFNINIIL